MNTAYRPPTMSEVVDSIFRAPRPEQHPLPYTHRAPGGRTIVLHREKAMTAPSGDHDKAEGFYFWRYRGSFIPA